VIALLALAVCAKGQVGQNVGVTSPPATPTVESSWPNVNLNVVMLDKRGGPQKVGQSEIRLFEDGAERPVQFIDSQDSPVSLAFVIDSSGSIFKSRAAIITAVKTIVRGLPDGSEVMAVLFADEAFLDLPFTPVSKIDFSFLDRLQARGVSGLYDAVVATEDHFIAHARYTRRALVILSDGEDNASHLSRGAVYRKMEQPDAPMIYACRVSNAPLLIPNDSAVGHINMRFLAKEGGGAQFSLDPDPDSAAVQIANGIRSQYVLRFTAADPSRDGREHKLAVRVSVKDTQILVLPVYFAPAK
jgi:Ca-activated chloride channel family protein